MKIKKQAVISSRFLNPRGTLGDFYEKVFLPSHYPYFEWEDVIYTVNRLAESFTPVGKFYSHL